MLNLIATGFYMFGNIDLLKNNSPLWSNIEATLAENGSVGKYIELTCLNHEDHITKVCLVLLGTSVIRYFVRERKIILNDLYLISKLFRPPAR